MSAEVSSEQTKVYNIFKDFFGEDRVDLQEYSFNNCKKLIVHFPEVTITNENNKSIKINHLWAKIILSATGLLAEHSFSLIKSEYSIEQFKAGYSHSHIPKRYSQNFTKWADPCLGSGPIRDTILSLSSQFSEDLWQLFCLELDKYVHTESLSGVPFCYLEKVGISNTFPIYPYFTTEYGFQKLTPHLEEFKKYLIKKRPFSFNYFNNSYGIAKSYLETLIIVSNLYIEWFNSLDKEKRSEYKLEAFSNLEPANFNENSKLGYLQESPDNINIKDYEGKELFTFKGNSVKLHITERFSPKETHFYLLTPRIFKSIINNLLLTINYELYDFTLVGKTIEYI